MSNEIEIVTEEWACFELDSTDVYLSRDRAYGYAKERDGDDDSDIIVLETEEGLKFEDEILLFGQDVLSKLQYLDYRTFV